MSQDDLLEVRRQFQKGSDWGFISRHGCTGRIHELEVEHKTVLVRTPRGPLQARVRDNTSIRKFDNSEELTLEDLTAGTLVTVNGQEGQSGEIEASEILVIPEGEGGFNIRPARKEGPAMLPVFP